MKVRQLSIPLELQEQYARAGITELYPPQVECVRAGIFLGKNLLISIPTASGKTLVAEMAMHHDISEGGKCLYIVPLKALASEKYEDFSGKAVKVGIATGDFDRRDEYLGRNDIIVATSEKVDSLLRNNAPWMRDITLLVVDEVHLIDDPDRGATVEMVITKMRYKNPDLQVIALSATIGNPGDLAGWLDASLVTSEWRPVDLREGVFYNGSIHYHDTSCPVTLKSKRDDLNLCIDPIDEGGQCLVFVSSRKNAEAFAREAASFLKREDAELTRYATELNKLAVTDTEKSLAACVEKGAAFHHAGLRREARAIVETGFRKGSIKCVSSTPTLAAGLNLPARRVIIRDYKRYSAGEGMVPIPVREYHQMAGRAGRPHLDPYGEAVLIGKDERNIGELFENYIDAPPEDIASQCASRSALCTHILSLIATRFVSSRAELGHFMERTFYMHKRHESRTIRLVIDDILGFLLRSEMAVELGGSLSATEFGNLVSQLYVDPESAETMVKTLKSAREYSDIGLLQLICSTPDMYTLYVSNKDLYYLERFACAHEDELWIDLPYGEEEDFYRGLKTAMVLYDWSAEVPEEMICERYSIGAGDIFNLTESVTWLLHVAGRISGMFIPHLARQVREYEFCMKYGIKRELLPLVRIRNIGRVRARRLFMNGIRSPAALLEAGRDRVSAILGQKVTDKIFDEIRRGQEEEEREFEREQTSLSRFG